MKGVFLDFDTVSHADIDIGPLRQILEPLTVYGTSPAGTVAERVRGAQVVLLNKVRLHGDLLHGATALRLVCLAATGTDNVDIEAARHNGIAVCNIRGYCTDSLVQHVFALILSLTVHLPGYQKLLREGTWQDSPQFTLLNYPVRELKGLRIGIVGYGRLGRGVAAVARAFGMEVMIAARNEADSRSNRWPLRELLTQVDILSLHCPLTPHTRGMISREALALMKTDAVLINTARGALVDEQALADALRAKRLGGAGIDVLSEEPPIHGNPLLDDRIPNLIVTPHVAWAARQARQRAIGEIAANIRAFIAGERRNRID